MSCLSRSPVSLEGHEVSPLVLPLQGSCHSVVQSLQDSSHSRSPVSPGVQFLQVFCLSSALLSKIPVSLVSPPGDLSLQCPVCQGVLSLQKAMKSLYLSCLSRGPVSQGVQSLQDSSHSRSPVSRNPVLPSVLSLKETRLSRSPVTAGVQPHQSSCLSRSPVSPGF